MLRHTYDIGLVIPLAEEFFYLRELVPIEEAIPYEGTFFYRVCGQFAVCATNPLKFQVLQEEKWLVRFPAHARPGHPSSSIC